jgi:endonuclease/exonuclease/phosphatase family metal-dependent hydrolase
MLLKIKRLYVNLSKGVKYTLFAVDLVFMLLLLGATKAVDVPPSTFVPIAYLGLGFPVLLLFNLFFLLLWIVCLRWKYIVVQLVILVFSWNTITLYFPFHSKTDTLPNNCLKVLSYNVRGFDWLTGEDARKNPILEYIASSNADIICLQEFAVEEKKHKNKILSLDEFDDIMADYPYRTVVRLGDMNISTIYGLACYSKYPIHKMARVPIESAFNGSAMYEIRIGKKRIVVVNNHLESNRITAEDKQLYKEVVLRKNGQIIDEAVRRLELRMSPAFYTREAQANIISSLIKQQRVHTDAMIVCGDFNDTPLSYAYQTIKGNFIDSYANTGKGFGFTYHENSIMMRIDYIMHTQNITSYNSEVGDVKYSDHYPIWSYLSLEDI